MQVEIHELKKLYHIFMHSIELDDTGRQRLVEQECHSDDRLRELASRMISGHSYNV